MWSDLWSWLGKNAMPLINTAFNGISSWFGQKQTNANIDKQLEAQKEEQQSNRDYNYQLWQDNNAYNSPAQQKARLEQAGLNADMMYGGSGVMNTASSPTPSLPIDWSSLANKRTIGDVTSQALDNQYKQAMIENVNADTENKGHEGSILASDAAFRDSYNKGVLATQNVEIRVGNATAAERTTASQLNEQKVKESQEYIRNLQASTEEIQASIDKIRNDISVDNARLDIDKTLSVHQAKLIASQYGLNEAQAIRLRSELEKVLRNLDDEHNINLAEIARINSSTGLQDAQTDLAKSQKTKTDKEYAILEIKKGVVQFKSNVLTAPKKDLTGLEALCRTSDAMLQQCLSGM